MIIGKGFLGTYLYNEMKSKNSVFSTVNSNNNDQIKLDILEKEALCKIIEKIDPDCIINCVANTKIDFLEKNPDIAYSINSEGVKIIAQVSKQYKIRLIHISTDNVFDGIKGMYNEEDKTNPVNVYGKSKEKAEQFVRDISDNYVIIRTNFYGIDPRGRDLLTTILNSLKTNKSIIGFEDIIYNPLEVSNLSQIIHEIVSTDFKGIIHLASDEVISKYDFAVKIAEIFGHKMELIKKGKVKDANLIAVRPKNVSLSNNKARNLLKTAIIPLEESLKKIKNRSAYNVN